MDLRYEHMVHTTKTSFQMFSAEWLIYADDNENDTIANNITI